MCLSWDAHYLHDGQLVRAANLSKHKSEDLKRRYTTDQYVENLSKIIDVMKPTGAKLIWASTTPYVTYGEDTKRLLAKNNKAAKALMGKKGVVVNDLYGLALPNLKKWQAKDGCHFTGRGYGELAKQVASNIIDILNRKTQNPKSTAGKQGQSGAKPTKR
jgi:lysophospholipase L1-like esterase